MDELQAYHPILRINTVDDERAVIQLYVNARVTTR